MGWGSWGARGQTRGESQGRTRGESRGRTRGEMDGNPVDRQRGPPTGLGITALTPTPRAVIPGTESQVGTRKRRLRNRGDKKLGTGRVQRNVPQSDTGGARRDGYRNGDGVKIQDYMIRQQVLLIVLIIKKHSAGPSVARSFCNVWVR